LKLNDDYTFKPLNIIAIMSVLHLILQVFVVKYYCYQCITLNYAGRCS
jgi:hypothetical protein